MMKSILTSLLLIVSSSISAQNTVDWLKSNVIPISTTDQFINSSKEYEPLKKVLAGKDIILLGEEDHVFASTFESKTKLVKFLHEQMGYTVLVFELDIYALSRAYQQATKENNPLRLSNTLYGFWGRVKSTESLYPYIIKSSQTSRPLKVIGMDCQSAPFFSLPAEIDSLLTVFKSPVREYSYYPAFKALFERTYRDISGYQYRLSEKERLLITEVFDDILFEFDLRSDKNEQVKILQQSLVNFRFQLNNVWLNQPSNYNFLGYPIPVDSMYGFVSDRRSMSSQNRRDKMMAENIRWIKNVLYPNEKIIVWAASEHSMYNRHEASFHNFLVDTSFMFFSRFKFNNGYRSMGTYLRDFFGNRMYSLGFTSLTGQVNFDRTGQNSYMGEVQTADNSLESYFSKLKTPNGILDFRSRKLPIELTNKDLLHNFIGGAPNTSGDISRFFDGIYFIRTAKPLEFIKR